MTIKLTAQAEIAKQTSAITLVFVSAYVCQGIAQHFCLIAQPMNYFFKVGLHLEPATSAFYDSLLMVPWVIKPIYGLLSDQLGFSRPGRSCLRCLVYLHGLAGLSYALLSLTLFSLPVQPKPPAAYLVLALVAVAGICIAFATVVFVAMTVDTGEAGENPRRYFGVQALSYSLANIAAVALGGMLCARLPAPAALAWGLLIAAAILFLMVPILIGNIRLAAGGTDLLSGHQGASLKSRLKAVAKSRPFLITLLFLTLWNLSPNLGVSLYYFECDRLHFSQGQIGTMAACTSTGTLIGAFVFRYYLAGLFHGGRSTYGLVALGAVSNLSYLLLSTPESGMVIEFFRGFATFVATLAIYGLAADVSPRGFTATAMAIQIAVFNLAQEGSIALGGYLYQHLFGRQLMPLIVVSSVTTLLTAILVPYLGRDRL